MLILIALVVFGSLMVYLAQNNLTLVTLHLGPYILADIPLFYVITGSLLAGLGFAYLFFLINSVSTIFTIHGKNSKIKHANNEIRDLNNKVRELELENEKLKQRTSVV